MWPMLPQEASCFWLTGWTRMKLMLPYKTTIYRKTIWICGCSLHRIKSNRLRNSRPNTKSFPYKSHICIEKLFTRCISKCIPPTIYQCLLSMKQNITDRQGVRTDHEDVWMLINEYWWTIAVLIELQRNVFKHYCMNTRD